MEYDAMTARGTSDATALDSKGHNNAFMKIVIAFAWHERPNKLDGEVSETEAAKEFKSREPPQFSPTALKVILQVS
nr:hypothetical protein HmN_000146800 [Hymenolepis microstoma]